MHDSRFLISVDTECFELVWKLYPTTAIVKWYKNY